MKQRYTHKELLSLRHEFQEPSVKAFFAMNRSKSAFSDFASKYFNPYAGHPRFEPSFVNSQDYPRRLTGVKFEDFSIYQSISNIPKCNARSKEDFYPLESYQLVKIPPSLGELPPGSRIIKVRAGAPVPENAIAISMADILGASGAKHTKKDGSFTADSPFWSEKSSKCHSSNKWDVDYETPSHDGVTNFAAGGKHNQIYAHPSFVPAIGAASEDATVVDAGTKFGLATRASSGTWASTETKFHYARFFEPYMRKLPDDAHANEKVRAKGLGIEIPTINNAPRTSCESDSATEYSSDSSNIQIQLPV